MNIEKLSTEVSLVLKVATHAANTYGQCYVGTDHLLFGLLDSTNQASLFLDKAIGSMLPDLRQAVTDRLHRTKNSFSEPLTTSLPFTPRVKNVFELAAERSGGDISALHLLWAILKDDENSAAHILKLFGLTSDLVFGRLFCYRPSNSVRWFREQTIAALDALSGRMDLIERRLQEAVTLFNKLLVPTHEVGLTLSPSGQEGEAHEAIRVFLEQLDEDGLTK